MSDSCFICSKHNRTIRTAGKMIFEDEYVFSGHIDNGENPAYRSLLHDQSEASFGGKP
ncbi:hypothetical protein [Fictibacillus solisalsi]|uniref:hypothetical protein n=1 Tax=Fictibacillus solisalsi TaxID=459525 RepID=UPI00147B9E0A|nr:hypothetical protein [Fictibacillus solisalsi]